MIGEQNFLEREPAPVKRGEQRLEPEGVLVENGKLRDDGGRYQVNALCATPACKNNGCNSKVVLRGLRAQFARGMQGDFGMDEQGRESIAVPGWFWAAAGLALLFEAFGCVMYLMQVTTDPNSLPIDQRAMWSATPPWIVGAYAVAVWIGLIGAVLLLMRRRLAVPVLLVSLVAVLIQFGGVMLVPALRQVTPEDAYTLPIAIIIACYGIFMLSRLADRRGWLR